MKKQFFRITLSFVSGVAVGVLIRLGITMIGTRPSSPGGELLILPMILLLVYFGYCIGTDGRDRECKRYYRRGYEKGSKDVKDQLFVGGFNCRHSLYPFVKVQEGGRNEENQG